VTSLVGLVLQVSCLGTGKCDTLRSDLLKRRDAWGACDPSEGDDVCVVVAGDSNDCTGVLVCNFAVHKTQRTNAEHAVIQNASDWPVCSGVCSSPSCSEGTKGRCDATLKRCVIDIEDAGTGGGEPPDQPYTSPPPPQKDSGTEASQ